MFQKKGVGTRLFLAASPLVTAPPSNLTRLYYNGSAAKFHSTTTQYHQIRRLPRIYPRPLTCFLLVQRLAQRYGCSLPLQPLDSLGKESVGLGFG